MIIADHYALPEDLKVDKDYQKLTYKNLKNTKTGDDWCSLIEPSEIKYNYFDVDSDKNNIEKICNHIWFNFLPFKKSETKRLSWSLFDIDGKVDNIRMKMAPNFRVDYFHEYVNTDHPDNWDDDEQLGLQVWSAEHSIFRNKVKDDRGVKSHMGFMLFLQDNLPFNGGELKVYGDKWQYDMIRPTPKRLVVFDSWRDHSLNAIGSSGKEDYNLKILFGNIWTE